MLCCGMDHGIIRAAVALGLVVGALLLNSPARSCAVFNPFRLEAIRNAPIVFKGQVVDYSLVRHPQGFDFATFTFKIVETYRGDVYDMLKLSWLNETFGLPKKWDIPDLIVAAIPSSHPFLGVPFSVFQETC